MATEHWTPEPRVWTMPDEPGMDVRAVRDAVRSSRSDDGLGELWFHLAPDEWQIQVAGKPVGRICGWAEVMEYAPLLDATEEVGHG